MSEERRFAHVVQLSLVALATLVVECGVACWWLLVPEGGGPLAAHLAITAALAVWCRRLRSDVRIPMLLTASTAALGPIGAAGTLFTMLLTRWYSRRAIPFDEWYQSLFPDTPRDEGDELAERVARAEPAQPGALTPFIDILAFGSFHEKQALIALINQQFRPAFGPILKRALTDGNNAIRVQAATAMNKLENTMLARTLELSRQVEDAPGDVEALLRLARHYDACLYSGTLDRQREEELRERTLDAFRRYLRDQPGDRDSWLAAGRLLLRGKRYDEAAAWLEPGVAASPQASLWYLESLYHLGRYDQLRDLARALHPGTEADVSPAALETLRLWESPEPVIQGEGAA